MRRAVAFLLAVAVTAAACSSAPDDTEVLGVVLESPSPTGAPSPEPVTTAAVRYPDPATVVYPERTAEAQSPQQPARDAEPAPPAQPEPTPTMATWIVPDGHVGEPGTVWTVERDDCGELESPCWIETSSTQAERGRVPTRNPLRVSLAEVTDTEAPERDAVCTGGLHADDTAAVEAHGTIVVQLLVDGVVVASSRTSVDVVIEPGSGIAAAELAGPVTVSVMDVDHVGCAVSFTG